MLSRTILALSMATALAPAASAHSLKELDAQLFGKEKYFQPMDVAAPEFSLATRTAEPSAWPIFAARSSS